MKSIILIAMIAFASLLVAAQDEGRGKDGKDGKYHDPETGEVQPDRCDNSFKNEHPCDCSRAKSCDPDAMSHHPTRVCKTWCRTNACGCVNECAS